MIRDVHVVVVRWRGGDEVATCLQSLLDHGGDRVAGVTLVDSGSGDGGAGRLAARFPSVRVLALPENLGFAHAANRGVEADTAPLQLLLNPDTVIGHGAVAALAATLDERPRTAGAVPVLVGPRNRPQHRWQLRRLPTPMRLAQGRSGAPAFPRQPEAARPVPQPAAAAWLVRHPVWTALGGLEEAFAPAWWEDVDFCARLESRLADPHLQLEEGFVVQPAVRLHHVGGSSLASLEDADFLTAYYRNLLLYASRHHHQRYRVIRAGLRLSLMVRAGLRPGRRDAYRAALRAVREA